MSGIIAFIVANYTAILVGVGGVIVALVALLKAIIVICLLIPGPQPEATLQKMVDKLQQGVDFLTQFSRK